MSDATRPPLIVPDGHRKVLLHSCCAPCAADLMREMQRSGIALTVLFYNPNIHPEPEYLLRKSENQRFAQQMGIPFVDLDYEREAWFTRVRGFEEAPERGIRCRLCFDMRFERSALYAVEHGFSVFTSSLGISRWKDMAQITEAGMRAAAAHEGLHYWTYHWRKGGGAERMVQIAKAEQFYQQEYCGCVYSLRDTNRKRARDGRPRIERGVRYYGVNPATPEVAEPRGPLAKVSTK